MSIPATATALLAQRPSQPLHTPSSPVTNVLAQFAATLLIPLGSPPPCGPRTSFPLPTSPSSVTRSRRRGRGRPSASPPQSHVTPHRSRTASRRRTRSVPSSRACAHRGGDGLVAAHCPPAPANLRPTTPATMSTRQRIRRTSRDSPRKSIPTTAVPAAPIPVQTA